MSSTCVGFFFLSKNYKDKQHQHMAGAPSAELS